MHLGAWCIWLELDNIWAFLIGAWSIQSSIYLSFLDRTLINLELHLCKLSWLELDLLHQSFIYLSFLDQSLSFLSFELYASSFFFLSCFIWNIDDVTWIMVRTWSYTWIDSQKKPLKIYFKEQNQLTILNVGKHAHVTSIVVNIYTWKITYM